MEDTNNDVSESRDVLYLVGGVSLIVLGVGLVMTNPTIQKNTGHRTVCDPAGNEGELA